MNSQNRMILTLMDEYGRATKDLISLLEQISPDDFVSIKDDKTKDKDCESIQSIMNHVISSGYSYANYISSMTSDRNWRPVLEISDSSIAINELIKMIDYTEQSMVDLWPLSNVEIDTFSVTARWGLDYSVEQMMEHAIVHILRHRRQIENFL